MQHKKLHIVALTVVIAMVMYGGWFVFANTLGRPTLDGETTHDFGIVMLDDRGTTLNHQFVLTNTTSEIIQIRELVSSCKCTTTALDDRNIAPGATLTLDTEVEVKKSGLQKAVITLVLGSNRIQKLYVVAVGRRKNPLNYIGNHIELLVNLPKILPMRCEIYNPDREPDPLIVRVTAGVTGTFRRWRLVELYDPEWQNPAIWEAELVLTRTALDLPEDAAVQVSLDGETWYEVPINRPDLVETVDVDSEWGSSLNK